MNYDARLGQLNLIAWLCYISCIVRMSVFVCYDPGQDQGCNVTVVPSSSARNLGVIFDKCFNFEEHVKSICKSSHYHLRNIAKIRKCIDEESARIVVHAFVTAKLDSCNSLLYGLPKHLLSRLQSIQNTAARVVTRTRNLIISPLS